MQVVQHVRHGARGAGLARRLQAARLGQGHISAAAPVRPAKSGVRCAAAQARDGHAAGSAARDFRAAAGIGADTAWRDRRPTATVRRYGPLDGGRARPVDPIRGAGAAASCRQSGRGRRGSAIVGLGRRSGLLRHGPRPPRSAQAHRLRHGARAQARDRPGDDHRSQGAPGAERRAAVGDQDPLHERRALPAGRGPQEALHDPGDQGAIQGGAPGAHPRAAARLEEFQDQALVFVHGYNNGFDDALFRTAQIAYDLKYDGAPFLYSWPSGAGIAGYPYDRESAQQAEPYLQGSSCRWC